MRYAALLVLALLSVVPKPAAEEGGIRVYFSPDGGAASAIIDELGSARRSIDIAAYSYTHAGIAKATIDAHKRGVAVRVVMDKTQSAGKYSSATPLHNAGIPVWIDDQAGSMHNKYMVIDGETVITGSINFTKAGDETNAENMLIITGREKLARAYAENFSHLVGVSKRYER